MLLLCAICLYYFGNEEESWIVTLTCGHQFHRDCITEAMNMIGEILCPICETIERVEWPLYPDRQLNHALFTEHMAAATDQARSHVVHLQPVPIVVSNATNVQYCQCWGRHSPQDFANRNCLDGVDHALHPSILITTRADAELRWADADADTSFPGARSLFNHPESQDLHHEENQEYLSHLSVMSFDRDSDWESHYGGSDPSHMSGDSD